MISKTGYRSNIAIVIINAKGQVLWAKRKNRNAWQFPQGGIEANETPVQTMYRELYEEVGIQHSDVLLLGCTKGWLYYQIPASYVRRTDADFRGQKQKWFLLQLDASDDAVKLDRSPHPEFDEWCWVSYWYPVSQIISFKRDVYADALQQLAHYLPKGVE